MKLLDKYLSLEKEILNYFGCKYEVSLAIEDQRNQYWFTDGDTVWHGQHPFTKDQADVGNVDDASEIFHNKYDPSPSVFVKNDYTMFIFCCDGDNFLSIFDNKKQLKLEE